MLLFKRLATAAIVFVLLFCLLFLTSLVVAGGIVASRAVKNNPDAQNKTEIARQAGEEFGEKYGVHFGLGALVVASAAALTLAFSGLLPWCRKPPLVQEPAPLPLAGATEPPPVAPVACKPHGFDPGLKGLLATVVFWLAIRLLMPLAKTYSSAVLATTLALLGVTVLTVSLLIVWLRYRKTDSPPRTWAIAIAVVWASSQLVSWLYIMFK